MSADTSTRLLQLDPLLEAKNPNVRNEAAAAFGKFSILDSKVVAIIKKHLTSQVWEARVSAGRALQAVLANFEDGNGQDNNSPSASFEKLKSIDVHIVLQKFKPLLSDSETSTQYLQKQKFNSQAQRELVDKHLEYTQITGLSSKKFLSDDEFLDVSQTESTSSQSQELVDVVTKKEPLEGEDLKSEEDLIERRKKFWKAIREFVNSVTEQQWYARHGSAIAICQIATTSYSKLSNDLIDSTLYLLIHVLILDKFNDFISGRNATAPVREQCAQALVHILRNTDETRRELLLGIVVQMVSTSGDHNWNVRQAGLLILKYYFAIARKEGQQKTFDKCFNLVIQSLNDSVDDVTGCAVKTLSSILSNKEIPTDEMSQLVEKVMGHVWKLLELESAKEQLRAGLDALCIDLLEIVELWLSWNNENSISRESLLTICSMLDASFPVRSEKIVQILDVDMERIQNDKLNADDVFGIIKQLYRILLFSPRSDSLVFLEKSFVTFGKIFKIYQKLLIEKGEICMKVGNWLGCLLLDHRNPQIDVFACDVDGISSHQSSPQELMGSEEMRFLDEKEKDQVYLTRKILCAKFLAIILESLYECDADIQGQKVDVAVQLLFVPFFKSTSIMHNLGVSIVVNEWAALYRAAVNLKTTEKPPPMTIVQLADSIVRGPGKHYDEMTSIVHGLTKDCNEFIEFCVVRGFNRQEAESRGDAVEEVSKLAYTTIRPTLKTDKQRESIDSRYNTLMRSIENAKMNIKSNGIRINALLSSTLFYFGNAPEKLTPQIRPIVETMQTEENDAMASEVFRGAVPLLVMFSWPRNPRPYVKVLAKAFESFSGCPIRMPKVGSTSPGGATKIISFRRIWGKETDDGFEEATGGISAESRNAELLMTILCQFSAAQLGEFYSHFDLSEEVDLPTFLIRLELHNSFWNRVGSRLSDQSTGKIFNLVPSEDPAIRYAFAKSIETFCKSFCGDTLSKCYSKLVDLSNDLKNDNARLSAVEVFLRLSMMDTPFLNGWATLLAPPLFQLLTDGNEAVRDAAGEAFRRLIPVVTIENPNVVIEGLSDELSAKRAEFTNFINVLGSPSSLPRVNRQDIRGGFDANMLREYQLEGITWMRFLRSYGMHGILADDMGLGKTLQTMCIVALSVDKDEMKAKEKCSLIVCPRTLVDHWCHEWNRFFPERPRASKLPKKCQGAEICVVPYEELKHVIHM
uniref:Helicase ATP-binding domain-containing protein n=1 Tax=Caenorhabditis japonica TaxID=281687 RepID=A0A8R1I4E9_CAEJA